MEINSTKKQLLYYDHAVYGLRYWSGMPIHHLVFKEVVDGKEIHLRSCYWDKEISRIMGSHYYKEITDMLDDYDILWQLSDKKIIPITKTFEEIQIEYQNLLNQGIIPQDINTILIYNYNASPKIKVLELF